MKNSELIIEKLKLTPHPEGGYFRETYRSEILIPGSFSGVPAERNLSTSIYYLLEEKDISLFHRIKSDEIWHHYLGSSVILHCLGENGYFKVKIGSKIEESEIPQFTVRANIWFAAEVEDKESYALSGCTVAPGFDFNDFEMGDRNELIRQFPEYTDLIIKFTSIRH